MEFWQGFWLIFGVVLVLSEILLPGGIAFFVGLGAVFVGALYFFELISDPLTGFTIWFILSITFLFTLKGFVDKFLPNTESKSNTDEDLDAFGARVKVVAALSSTETGRIEFQGSTWPARARNPQTNLQPGDMAVIVFRDNMTWLVDAVDESNTNQEGN